MNPVRISPLSKTTTPGDWGADILFRSRNSVNPQNVTNRAKARYPACLPLTATAVTQCRLGVRCRWFSQRLKPKDAKTPRAEVKPARFHARPGASWHLTRMQGLGAVCYIPRLRVQRDNVTNGPKALPGAPGGVPPRCSKRVPTVVAR